MDSRTCEELAKTLKAASRLGKRAIIEEYMARYKAGRTTVYRWARAGGYDSGRNGCGGPPPKPPPAEKLEVAAKLIHATATRKYSPTLTTERAIRVGVQSGFWEEGELTVDMVNRFLREHYPRRPPQTEPPHIPRRPDYVNQFGEFDVSVCAQYYLKPDETVGTQDPTIYWTKNKRGKGPPILRAIYTEVITNAFWVEYFTGAEAMENVLPVLWRGWMPKADESKYPLKGMPEILLADKGSGLKNSFCENLFENLGVEFRTHKRGQPQAKGSVETLMWYVERAIESLLRFQPASTVEDLNRKIQPILIELNGINEHSRYGMPRSVAFSSWVEREHLRLPPSSLEHFLSLAYREYEATVSSQLGVRFKGVPYSFLGDTENYSDPAVQALKGQRVTVMYCPFDENRVKIVTKDGQMFYPARVIKDKYGYPSFAVRMRAPGSAPAMAAPEWKQRIDRLDEIELPGEVKAFANEDLLKNMRFMTKAGIEFESKVQGPESKVAGPSMSRLEAKRELQERLGRKLEKEESERLNGAWGEMVAEEQIEREEKKLQPRICTCLRATHRQTDLHGLEKAAEGEVAASA